MNYCCMDKRNFIRIKLSQDINHVAHLNFLPSEILRFHGKDFRIRHLVYGKRKFPYLNRHNIAVYSSHLAVGNARLSVRIDGKRRRPIKPAETLGFKFLQPVEYILNHLCHSLAHVH